MTYYLLRNASELEEFSYVKHFMGSILPLWATHHLNRHIGEQFCLEALGHEFKI